MTTGRRWKVEACDVVSANIPRTAKGDLLRPCEMPVAKVMEFLRGWEPA